MNYNEIAPRFRKRKAYAAEWLRARDNIVSDGEYKKLEIFINDFITKDSEYYGFANIMLSLHRLTLVDLRYIFALSILEKNLKYKEVGCSLVILLFSEKLNLYNYERQKEKLKAQGRNDTPMAPTNIFFAGHLVAFLVVFTNKNVFNDCIGFVLDQFDVGAVSGTEKPLAPMFMIRLAEKFIGIPPRDWEGENKPWSVKLFAEEPLFAELWQHWDTEDMELIHSLLIQLANRHTFTASRNNKDGSRDFAAHAEQYPIDLHFIMRLREWRGLANPEIKHRLTEPPFDRLPEPIETIELPDELYQVMKKTREVIPDFDAVINAAKKREWQMLL